MTMLTAPAEPPEGASRHRAPVPTGRRRRRPRLAGAAVVVLLAVAAACSDGADEASTSGDGGIAVAPADLESSDMALGEQAGGGDAPVPDAAERKRIRTAQVSLVTPEPGDVVPTADAAVDVAVNLGGTVDDDDRTHGDDPRVTLVLRIPPDELETAVEQLSALAEVRSSAIQTEDVTAQYTDIEGRIATLETSVERLRALIADASDIVQIVSLEGELTNREAQLESALGQLRVLSEQTDLATVSVTIAAEQDAIEETKEDAPSPGTALSNGWDAFVAVITWAVAIVLTALPFLVTALICGLAIRWFARRHRSRHPRPARPAPAPWGAPPPAPPVPYGEQPSTEVGGPSSGEDGSDATTTDPS